MSKFDDIFNEKLNEEQSFQGQNRSWAQLNQNLSSFESGRFHGGNSLVVWKAIGIFGLICSLVLLFKHVELKKENKKLHEMAEQYQTAPKPTQNIAEITPVKSEKQGSSNQENHTISGSKMDANNSAANQPNAIEQYPQAAKEFIAKSADNEVVTDLKTKKNQGAIAEKSKENASVATKSPAPQDAAIQAPQTPVQEKDAAAVAKVDASQEIKDEPVSAQAPSPALPQDAPVPSNNAANPVSDGVATIDSAATQPAPKSPEKQPEIAKVEEKKPTPLSEPMVPPIKPVNGNPRFQAGVELMAGFGMPKEKGVSTMLGQGAKVEFRLWKQLSIGLGATALRFDVNADTLPRHLAACELPPGDPDPGGPPHEYDIKKVESDQALQRYRIEAKYNMHLKGRWYASGHAGYNLVRVAPALVSIMLEKEHHNPGWPGEVEFFAKHTKARWVSNVLNGGIGIHYQTRQWNFGVNSDICGNLLGGSPASKSLFVSTEFFYRF